MGKKYLSCIPGKNKKAAKEIILESISSLSKDKSFCFKNEKNKIPKVNNTNKLLPIKLAGIPKKEVVSGVFLKPKTPPQTLKELATINCNSPAKLWL